MSEVFDAAYTHEKLVALGVAYPRHAEKLATLSLLGFCVRCSHETPVGNRWWTAFYPDGLRMPAVGGRDLLTVVGRMWSRAASEGRV